MPDDSPPPETSRPAFDPAKAHLAADPIGRDRQLLRARYSADGALIAAGGTDKLIHLWETESRRHYTLPGHATWISALVFHPKKPRLYTADFHGTVRAWDATQENSPALFSISADSGFVRALTVTSDGGTLVTAGDSGLVRTWDAESGSAIGDFAGHGAAVYSLAVHPEGKHVVSGDLFGRVIQWEIASGKLVRELDAKQLHTRKEDFLADVGGVRCFAFNAEGTLLACGGLSNAESNAFCPGTPLVLVFDWATGVVSSRPALGFKSDGPINGLRYLRDGTLAGWGEHLNAPTALVFWKPGETEPFHKLAAESAYDLDLHPDGMRLLAPVFKSMGSGGNGARKEQKGKYIPNAAHLLVCNLWQAAPKKA